MPRYSAAAPPRPRSSRSDAPRLLSAAEERALLDAWQERGDRVALGRLLAAFRRLVLRVVRRFAGYGIATEDLVQEGTIALMQAANKFDRAREVRFSTYALWWVRAAIQDHVLRNWSIVRIGTTAAQKRLFFTLNGARARLRGDPGAERLARHLGVRPADLAAMTARLGGRDLSLNAPAEVDGDAAWQDFLADPAPLPEAAVGAARGRAAGGRILAAALAALPARERQVIQWRLVAERPLTLQEAGRHLGVSKERVRQIEKRALAKLRARIEAQHPDVRDLIAA